MSAIDQMFNFAPLPKAANGGKQRVYGVEYETYTQILEAQPADCSFFLPGGPDQGYFFATGPNTRFKITGGFEWKETAESDWAPCPAAQSRNVIVAPNWFDFLIREVDMFCGSSQVYTSDERRYMAAPL